MDDLEKRIEALEKQLADQGPRDHGQQDQGDDDGGASYVAMTAGEKIAHGLRALTGGGDQ